MFEIIENVIDDENHFQFCDGAVKDYQVNFLDIARKIKLPFISIGPLLIWIKQDYTIALSYLQLILNQS